jgi:hypothetical protein
MAPMTVPAIAPEERALRLEDGAGEMAGLAIDVVVSEGYPSPGLNIRVEFLA